MAEAKVRQQALQEIHRRLRHFPQGDRRGYVEGSWSGFEYDFSNSVFFYPVDMRIPGIRIPLISAGARTTPAPSSAVPPMNEAPIFAILRTTIGFSSTTQPILVTPSGAGLRT